MLGARWSPCHGPADRITISPPSPVRESAASPAAAVLGEMLASDGTGLFTVKVKAPLVPPPEVFTVTDSDPATARSAAVSVAVNWVLLTKVVLRLTPLTWTADALTKLAPVAVSVTRPRP